MRGAVVKGSIQAALMNLVAWIVLGVAGIVPGATDAPNFAISALVASAFGVIAASVVARRFTGLGARKRWDRVALVVLILSLASPIGLAAGLSPINIAAPSDLTYESFRTGMALVYALMHISTYAVVQGTVARQVPN